MRPAFPVATFLGYVGPDPFAGPIRLLFDWNDNNGPATDNQPRFASVEVQGTVACVRLETDD